MGAEGGGDGTQNGIRIYRVSDRGLVPDGAIRIYPAQIPFPRGVKRNNPALTPAGFPCGPIRRMKERT
jgi:hypothetical protein